MIKKLSQWLSRKINNSITFKIGDIYIFDIMKFLVGATSVGPFAKTYKVKRINNFSFMVGLTVRTSSGIKSYLYKNVFSENWEKLIPLKMTLKVTRTSDQADMTSKNCWTNFKSGQYQHLDRIISNFCRIFSWKLEWLH